MKELLGEAAKQLPEQVLRRKPRVLTLNVNAEPIGISFRLKPEFGCARIVLCTTPEEVSAVLERIDDQTVVRTSELIDFPWKATKRKWVIDWCEKLSDRMFRSEFRALISPECSLVK